MEEEILAKVPKEQGLFEFKFFYTKSTRDLSWQSKWELLINETIAPSALFQWQII